MASPELLKKLKALGADAETIKAVTELGQQTELAGEGQVLKTAKGALMVRVSAARWPIAMYGNDWRILLKAIPQIEHGLAHWGIPDVNPEPAEKKAA